MIPYSLRKNIDTYHYEFNVKERLRIWRPCSSTTVPCILWNHGSKGDSHLFSNMDDATPPSFVLAYLKMGIGVFMFSRLGYNGVEGLSLDEKLKPFENNIERCDISLVKILEKECEQILTQRALIYNCTWVAQKNVICAGYSLGGILALLAVNKTNSFCAGISFSPGAMMWEKFSKVRELIINTVMRIQTPLMIIQAKNDYNIAPAVELNKIFKKNKRISKVLIYPKHGINAAQAHNFFNSGAKIWCNDVAVFLKSISIVKE